jgi:hypothetical protein
MCKLFTEILPCGILPALSQHISQASELGIFENQYCLGCLPRDIPATGMLLGLGDFMAQSQILPTFTSQSFFQTLTTSMVESTLLGIMVRLIMRYVFVFDFWK